MSNVFIVENIVDKKIKRKKIFYKVKWEGYESSENTWEPIESLQEKEVKILIENYEKSLISSN